MRGLVTAALLLLSPLLALCGPIPDTVDTLDLDAYSGRWYQVYGNKITSRSFERVGACHIVDIASLDRGVLMHHSMNKKGPGGQIVTLNGMALIGNPRQPGKMIIDFPALGFKGWYMVMAVGPVVDNKYQYAVVSDAETALLYVLARDVAVFEAKYEKEVLAFLEEKGFASSGLTKPIKTPQGGACVYEDPSFALVDAPPNPFADKKPERRLRSPLTYI